MDMSKAIEAQKNVPKMFDRKPRQVSRPMIPTEKIQAVKEGLEMGLMQKEVAELVGVSVSTVAKVAHGGYDH